MQAKNPACITGVEQRIFDLALRMLERSQALEAQQSLAKKIAGELAPVLEPTFKRAVQGLVWIAYQARAREPARSRLLLQTVNGAVAARARP